MKCVACGSELSAGAEYCGRCGLKVGSPPVPLTPVASAADRKRKILLSVLAAVAVALAGYFGWRAFAPSGKVVQAVGQQAPAAPLTEAAGKVAPAAPLVSAEATTPEKEPEPTEIIDYLRFLKDIERRRVLVARQQMGELLAQSTNLPMAGAMADWTTNEPEQKYREVYQKFLQSLNQWAGQWQELAAAFLGYPKPVPQACAELRDRYYAVLTSTSRAMNSVGYNFSEAMAGNTQKALEMLTQMQGSGLGSASKEIFDACLAADEALAQVCERFKLKKDFDIRDDLGGGNILGR